jgi:acetyl-CoA carboxylase biotin carboxyl carrier protein
MMSLSSDEIRQVLKALQDSDWDHAEVSVGDVTLTVSRNGWTPGPPVPASAPAPQAPATAPANPAPAQVAPAPVTEPVTAAAPPTGPVTPDPAPSGDHVIASPTIGVFWRSPSPGAPPFVEVGSAVAAGDTLGIVEVMKLMTNITSDLAGVVTAIYPENSAGVEAGTPLFAIKAG